jgi:imidazolonepropionase-like amidohydrolase
VTTVIRAGRLIDGTGAAPIDDPVVVVDGSTIRGVFQGEAPDGAIPADATVLDHPGATLLPGLIDVHVHLNLPGDGTPFETTVQEPDGVLVASSANAARIALEAGITTVRDTGGRGTTTFELRRAFELGLGRGARLVLCGQPITITGGHTWYFGGEADGIDGVRQKVRDVVKQGADFVKVMGTGGGTVNTISWKPSFSRQEIAAIVDEAHRQNRRCTIHCLCAESIEYAVDAGVDGFEHASFMIDDVPNQRYVPEVGEKLARSGALVTGTLAVGGAVVRLMRSKSTLTDEEQALLARWEPMLEDNLRQFGQLHAAGVQFVAGTDAGWRHTPFDGLAEELVLMHEGGMPAMEAIVSATSRAATAVGLDGVVGQVKEGFDADLIAVDGDPLDDLWALRAVQLVVQRGRVEVARSLAGVAG